MKKPSLGLVSFAFTLGLGALAAPAALAQTTATKVGGRGGLVDIDNVGSTFGLGGFADIAINKSFSLRPSIDYWSKTEEAGDADFKVEATFSDLIFAGAGKYTFAMPGSAFKPYVVGGLAMHRLSVEISTGETMAAGGGSLEASTTEMGFDFGGGFGYALSRELELSGEFLLRTVDNLDLMTVTAGLSHTL